MSELLLGRYEIQAQLGRGGFSTVYRAVDYRSGVLVAIKALRGDLAVNADFVRRLRREAHVLQQLPPNPHIARLIELGVEGGTCFLVMEYLDGEDLADVLSRGRLAVPDVVGIGLQVADALRVAHHHGIVHRDIKPQNIRLTSSGVVKLMDFGIARDERGTRLTGTASLIGTPEYIPPEVWEGHPATPCSDIYALGVVLYEALAGSAPYEGETIPAIMRQHLEGHARPLREIRRDLPPGLESIIFKAMARRPSDRFASADALIAALTRPDRPVATPPVPQNPAIHQPVGPSGLRADTRPGHALQEPAAFLVGATGQFRIRPSGTMVGRDPRSDILLQDPRTSNIHARIELTPAGYVLRDLGSRNGTFVNGQRVAGQTILRHGDRLDVGQSTFQFLLPSGTASPRGSAGSSSDAGLVAGLCHALAILTLVSPAGLPFVTALIPLAIWLVNRRRSPWLAFQALQAAVFQCVVMLSMMLVDLGTAIWLWLAVMVYAGIGAVRSSQGHNFEYVGVGPLVAQAVGLRNRR